MIFWSVRHASYPSPCVSLQINQGIDYTVHRTAGLGASPHHSPHLRPLVSHNLSLQPRTFQRSAGQILLLFPSARLCLIDCEQWMMQGQSSMMQWQSNMMEEVGVACRKNLMSGWTRERSECPEELWHSGHGWHKRLPIVKGQVHRKNGHISNLVWNHYFYQV